MASLPARSIPRQRDIPYFLGYKVHGFLDKNLFLCCTLVGNLGCNRIFCPTKYNYHNIPKNLYLKEDVKTLSVGQ